MAEDIRLSVGADTTQMESQIANAARKASVVIRPTIDSKGIEKISAPLGRITGQADEFTKSMEAANARVLAFGASVGVLNAVAKGFQSIVTASTQVEASLKEIQVATGETSGNLEKLSKGIFEVAKSTGLSFKQASEATLEFARQGGTLEDSLMKAKAALVLTRTTGLDAAEAVKGLTAAVLSFNQVGLDYETVVNKLAAVDTKFAVSSRDLIEGISRSASVAQEAGVSFDELTALITTLQEKTARGGAVIGNALKTIFQRVQTTENLDYIRNLGIAVTDTSENILPATKIIKDLANEFQNLDSATRKGLLIKIGGGFQIDKLAALLNDISNANGTFNRSLDQSTNAGNQGFAKLEQLNKTVQASFDRLATSGTQFASTVGKIAFSEDFKSILNKTSSFLESLNESVSGGEEGGATIGKALVKGIGSIITGPGALLIAGLGIKLFGDLAKFGVDSLKNQLGVTNVKKEQQDIEKSILGLLLQNTAVQTKIVSLEGNKAAQAEYLLGLYSKQAATLEKMSKLSKDIGPSVYEGGIRLTTEGTKNVKTAADGFMPLGDAIKSERKNAPAGAKIILDKNFPMGGGEVGAMVYNSSETRIKNFANGGDAIIPNFASKPAGQIQTNEVAGLTIGGNENLIKPRAITISDSKGGLTKLGQELIRSGRADIVDKYSSLEFAQPVPIGNIYRRLYSLQDSEEKIKDDFRERMNKKLSPEISTTIQSELELLGINPTKDIARNFEAGRIFNLVGKSEAGLIFENMLKVANLNSKEIEKFSGSDNKPFDIYNLKKSIGEQYFGEGSKGDFKYVEVRSDSSSLKEALTRKYLDEGIKYSPELLTNITGKTAAKGYVPNFAGTANIKGVATRFNKKIGDVYDKGESAIRSTFDNPKTALRGTLAGEESQYGGFFNIKLDESSIVASILGNNMFFGSEEKAQELTRLAVRSSSQGATRGKSENLGMGFTMQRLNTQPENVISSTAQGKFKKIDYTKLGKVLPRFWKSKGLGEVWEKTKIAAAKKAGENSYFSNYSEIIKARPDLREFLNSPNAIRENNKILRDSVLDSVLKKDPNIAGFFVDLIGSEEREGLGFGNDYVNYLMPFNANPLSNIKSEGLVEDERKQKQEQEKWDSKVKAFKENGAYYKDFVKNKSGYEKYGKWGNYDKDKKAIYLISENARTAAKGYVPNFASEDVDGDGTVTRNDPFIKKLMESLKKFSPVGKELTNNIVGNLLNLPEGIDVFEIIEKLKFAMKAQEPERELNAIKNQAEFARKYPKKAARIKEYLEAEEARKRNRTAAKGYIPNFSKDAILDAIGREQKESGLPLSAIKVVQDARVRGPKNPNGYAVINNRDEPDGRVPNFASGTKEGLDKEALANYVRGEIKSFYDDLKNFKEAVKAATESLSSLETTKFGKIGISQDEVKSILKKIIKESGGDVGSGGGSPPNATTGAAGAAGAPDPKKAQADNSELETQIEHTKTVQDSLYTLIRYQTVIAGVTGALSTLGGGFETFGKTLGGAANTLITLREGANITKEFLGTRKEGDKEVQNTFKDLFKNVSADFNAARSGRTGVEGVQAGLRGAVSGGNLGTLLKSGGAMLGTYATVASEAYSAIDSIWSYFGNATKKQEDVVLRLNEAMKEYNLTLSEQAKMISNRGVEEFSYAGSASTVAGALNKTTLFSDFFKSFFQEGDVRTNLRSTRALKESGVVDTKDIILPLYQAIAEQKVSENKTLPEKERKTSSQIQENIDQEVKNQIATLFGKSGLAFEEGVTSLIKKITPKAERASMVAKENQPIFGVSIDVLKNSLDTQYQIQKLLRERTSIVENQLSIEKDLLTTSQSRRSNIEFQLKTLDLERQKQSEISDIVFEASQNKFSAILGNKPNVSAETAESLKKAFAELGKVTNLSEAETAYNNIYQTVTKISSENGKLTEKQKEELQKLKETIDRQIKKNDEKKREVALENLKISIATKLNFIENNKRESLNAELSLGQKRIEQLKQYLDFANRISDTMYETATLPTPNQDPYIKERSDLMRSLETNRPRQMQDFEIQKASALQADRMTALNVALQRGANAADVGGIVNAPDYKALEDALQKVLDTEAKSINDRVKEAGDAFYNKSDAAATNVVDKIGNAIISALQPNSQFALGQGAQVTPLGGALNNPIGMGGLLNNISLSGTRETLSTGPNAPAGKASNLLVSGQNGPINPNALISRQDEQKIKQLIFLTEKKALDRRLEVETASITNAQKAIDLRKQEREWVQKVKDSAFELYKTQLSPYQAEKQTTFRNIETERTQSIQDNKDQIESARLQARQAAFQTLQSRGASLQQISEYESGSKSGGAILKELADQISVGDSFSGKVVSAAEKFEEIITRSAEKKANPSTPIPQNATNANGLDAYGMPSLYPSNDGMDLQNAKKRILEAESKTGLSLKQAESVFQGSLPAIPKNTKKEADEIAQNRTATAMETYAQQEQFTKGLKAGFREIDDELTKFDAVLGRQIPMNFRDGLVDAMKALSDPNSTASLKERLMGVAAAFLNKINDALMTNTANKITQGVGNLFGQGFASGGSIKGGSGTKDDVPAMLMGGEYVINKKAVSKYGKDFFDKLNSGKLKGFANGGMIGFEEANTKDLAINPTKYTPFGQTRMGGLSFDESGNAIGIDNYKLAEGADESKVAYDIKTAQTDFYSRNAQNGQGGFFTPGAYGTGAIMGQKNLLDFATQQTAGTQFDKLSYRNGMASVDLAGGSANLTLAGIRNQENLKNTTYLESKEKGLDLYFQGIDATKQKYRAEEEARKEAERIKKEFEAQKKAQKKAMLMQIGTTLAMAGIGALGNSMSSGMKAAQQAYALGQGPKPGFMGGAFSGATINGETFGGLKNAFSFNSNAFRSADLIGIEGGGAKMWNSKLGGYSNLTNDQYNTMAPNGVSWSSGMVGRPNPYQYSWNRRAAGGFVSGTGTGDNVPTMLNGGEFVMSKQAAERIGQNNLQKMNSGMQNASGSDEALSRLEAKFEEIIDKVTGVGTININVNSEKGGSKNETESGQSDDSRNKEMARKIKEVVLNVLRDEKRLGGLLR